MPRVIARSNGPVPFGGVRIVAPWNPPRPGDVILCYDLEHGDCCEMDACGWVTFVVLLLVFWPLCWIPFVCDECRVRYQRPVYGVPGTDPSMVTMAVAPPVGVMPPPQGQGYPGGTVEGYPVMPPPGAASPGYAPAGYPPVHQQGATYVPNYQGNPYPPTPGAVPPPAGYPGAAGPSTGAPAAMPPGATAPTDEYYKPPKVV